jgi:hypothetical protein
LLITFGIRDREAWLGTVAAEEVRAILCDTDGFRATGPGEAVAWQGLPPTELGAAGEWRERAVAMLETAA